MASPGSVAREAQNYMKLCVAHTMTQNITLNKVHVAATELPQQLLSQKRRIYSQSRDYSRAPSRVFTCSWPPYVIGQLLSFSRLISAVGDWMSTILPHMVWPYCKFRMQV